MDDDDRAAAADERFPSRAVLLGVGILVLLLLLLLTPWVDGAAPGEPAATPSATEGAATPAPTPSPAVTPVDVHDPVAVGPVDATDLCERAVGLVDLGYPQLARDLLAEEPWRWPVRSACSGDAQRLALVRIADADVIAAQATSLVAAQRYEEAAEVAAAALAVDRANAAALAARSAAGSPPVAVVTYWADVLPEVEHPLDVALLAAGIVLVLAVLARFAVTWLVRWPQLTARESRWTVLAGLVVLMVGAVGVAGTVTGSAGPLSWAAFWSAMGWAVIGAGVLTVGLATRLRLTIEALGPTGTEDAALSGRVIALLGELGVDAPQGIEVPRGADAEALAGSALSDLPEGRWAKVAVSLARSVLGTTPWRVTVNAQGDGRVAVSMTRNGRAVGSALVSTALLGLPGDDAGAKAAKAADLNRLVAAFVLVTLDGAHRGFTGMGGVTDWRSLGLHAIATGDLTDDDVHARHLLAAAVDQDRGNWFAQVALRHGMWRASTRREELDQYVDWLDDAIPRVRTHPTIALRLRTTRALAEVNRVYAAAAGAGAPGVTLDLLRDELTEPTRALVLEVDRAVRGDDRGLRTLARATQPIAHALVVMLAGGEDVSAWLGAKELPVEVVGWGNPASPGSSYALACTYATFVGVGIDVGGSAATAIPLLRVALTDRRLGEWAAKDPQLAGFVTHTAYLDEFAAKPRTDLLAIAPLSTHAKRLTALGLDTPGRLGDATPGWLAAALPAAKPVARELVAVAKLRIAMSGPALQVYGVEVLASLVGRQVARRSALTGLGPAARAALAAAVAGEVLTRCRWEDGSELPKDGEAARTALAAAIVAWIAGLV